MGGVTALAQHHDHIDVAVVDLTTVAVVSAHRQQESSP